MHSIKSMTSYREKERTQSGKERHEAVALQVVDMTMSRVDSEVLLLSFLMMGLTVSVLVNKRYDYAQGQTAKDS